MYLHIAKISLCNIYSIHSLVSLVRLMVCLLYESLCTLVVPISPVDVQVSQRAAAAVN